MGSLKSRWPAVRSSSSSGTRLSPPRLRDADRDGIPDVCQARPRFHRGDADGSGDLALADPIFIIAYLFLAGPEPSCREAADADNDGRVDLTDAIGLLDHLF